MYILAILYTPQSSTNTKLGSCFEYRGLMIESTYFVGGGLRRLLNINLFIASVRKYCGRLLTQPLSNEIHQ